MEFVPNWTAYSKNDPYYRFLAVREPMRKPPLPGMEVESDRASRFVNMHELGWYKVSGVVTNRTIDGEELIRWYRERCGKGEEVHGVLKRPRRWAVALGTVRSQCRLVVHRSTGVQPRMGVRGRL